LLTNTAAIAENTSDIVALQGDIVYPTGLLAGLTTEYVSDEVIKVLPGMVRAYNDASVAIELTSELTKNIGATWGTGDGAGAVSSVTATAIADNILNGDYTTLYVFVIMKDDGTVDIGVDHEATAVNLLIVSSYSYYYPVMALVVDPTDGYFIPYKQYKDKIIYDTQFSVVNASVGYTNGVNETFALPVPAITNGVLCDYVYWLQNSHGGVSYFHLTRSDTTATPTVYNLMMWPNASGALYELPSNDDGSVTMLVGTQVATRNMNLAFTGYKYTPRTQFYVNGSPG
jgi:hypothetical protein